LSSKHLLALGALTFWGAAGCASILGVDSSDYGDAAGILCTCADDQDECAAKVEERVAADAELEQTALDCMAVDPACEKVAACVAAAGYCAARGKACLPNAERNPLLACCEGLECAGGACCGGAASECTGNGECCSGSCVDGACGGSCVPVGDSCVAGDTCCAGSCSDSGRCRVVGG
jgi:hypothetical protein